jgi:hypothetical protein
MVQQAIAIKKPREAPGAKKRNAAATRRKEYFFFLVILDVLTMCYNNMYIEEKQ